ncbi:MAG TPA: AAC(3) family N-acetyltransferase [Candidatus Acidoferrum sp.]|nr:AAC(3) family N-acetyltransferase [Candidatus Acidoferrum sp.]
MSREADAVAAMLPDGLIPPDGVLVVHSAFRGLGHHGYRVNDFIEALLDRLGGRATLLMPAMSWRTVTPSNPTFDELATPSHVGVVAEAFRVEYSAARSLHPTHSVSGVGPAAATLLARHHADDTPVSANSPYGLMRDYEAFVLLLGVGFERATAIHHAEEVVAPDLYLHPPHEAETYQCRTRLGTSRTVRLRRHLRLDRDFPQFEGRLASRGRLLSGEVAGTRWRLTSVSDLLREVFAALIARPDATLAR